MIYSILLGVVFGCLFVATGFLMWRVRRLEKDNRDLQSMVASIANLVFEVSKVANIIQDGTLEQGKGMLMLAKQAKESKEEFLEFKENVDKFVGVMVQQLNLLHGSQKVQPKPATTSPVFGPVKKNDKIKPN